MPPGEQHQKAQWPSRAPPRLERAIIKAPLVLSNRSARRFFCPFQGVIDDDGIGAKTRNRSAHADCPEAAAVAYDIVAVHSLASDAATRLCRARLARSQPNIREELLISLRHLNLLHIHAMLFGELLRVGSVDIAVFRVAPV